MRRFILARNVDSFSLGLSLRGGVSDPFLTTRLPHVPFICLLPGHHKYFLLLFRHHSLRLDGMPAVVLFLGVDELISVAALVPEGLPLRLKEVTVTEFLILLGVHASVELMATLSSRVHGRRLGATEAGSIFEAGTEVSDAHLILLLVEADLAGCLEFAQSPTALRLVLCLVGRLQLEIGR